jgi:uncharacterized protein (DUF885 family)
MKSHWKSTALSFGAILALGACAHQNSVPTQLPAVQEAKSVESPASASQALSKELDALTLALLRESPEAATSLGLTEEQAGGRFNNRLSDYSVSGLNRAADIGRNALAKLNAIPTADLTSQEKVSQSVVSKALGYGIDGAQFGYGTYGNGAVQPYVVTQLSGAFTAIPDFLDSQHQINSAQSAADYLERLKAYARVLDQETSRIEADAAGGVIAPDFVIDGALKQLRDFAAKKPQDTVLVSSFVRRAKDVAGLDVSGMNAQALAITRDEVLPAYRRQIAALEAIRPRASHDAGVWRLPNGDALYRSALKAWNTTDLTPDEIHALGLKLIAELTVEMDAILDARGLTKGSVAARIQKLSEDKSQIYPNTDAGKDLLLRDLNVQIRAIEAKMPEVFGVSPKAKLEIKRVPAYIEAGAPGGYYQSAALDGSRPGAYYINLRDTAEWPKFTLPTLTYHEGVPGHHWQGSVQQESTGLPFIRSAILWFSGYGEGWALYSEQLADEIGAYRGDPLGRLGYLQSMTFRAARLVVDTGLHAKHWSREQAIDYMVGVTGDQRSSIATEVERYCVWPGQATAYMVGRETINRLRAKAKAELGDKFDLKAFHDVLLTNGSMPLSVMEEVVDAWIAQRKAGAG